ncbi:hypothetical protein HOY80DRAFT_987009 [Tuber brumale]|nr:hypothetical protein HOY80DRAFT_987009 [Tuber brumale]
MFNLRPNRFSASGIVILEYGVAHLRFLCFLSVFLSALVLGTSVGLASRIPTPESSAPPAASGSDVLISALWLPIVRKDLVNCLGCLL